MDKARRDELIAALVRREATQPCPRCTHTGFSVVDEAVIPLQSVREYEADSSEAVIPVVVAACARCGYISQHALSPLGLEPVGAGHAD